MEDWLVSLGGSEITRGFCNVPQKPSDTTLMKPFDTLGIAGHYFMHIPPYPIGISALWEVDH
jgi:hypothetical protein